MGLRVLMGCYFYPRGGSSHAARALSRELRLAGHEVTVVAGSRSDIGPVAEAERFFGKADLHVVDYTPALASALPSAHSEPGDAPMHASYEDRIGAEDVVLTTLDDELYELQVEAWTRAFDEAGAEDADVFYLNHLTPLNEVAAREYPDTPVIAHIHGPELLMLERIADDPPTSWAHAGSWRRRICRWAESADRLIANTPQGTARAARVLDIEPSRFATIPNGFDSSFIPSQVDRKAHWREHLVDNPLGWRPGSRPGGVSYEPADLHALEGTTFLYSGRFTEVKRLPVLIEALARVLDQADEPAALVLLGGYPGEWEDEHPIETIERLGVPGVFLAGWHDHTELPAFLAASDLLVHASVNEQFGQVLVEAMACELPVVAVDRGGPASIVVDGETGWLVEPEDVDGLARAMGVALTDPDERRRRGAASLARARAHYSWEGARDKLAGAVAEVAERSREMSGLRTCSASSRRPSPPSRL